MKLSSIACWAALLLAAGAAWAKDTTNHWAFQPLRRPAIPVVADAGRNPIDAFIRARLQAEQLTNAPEADPRALIRRLSLDFTGLPPTPDEVEAFVVNRSPEAYDALVERGLSSPRFGERWARHWLDVVRFAETHGFEMNNPRPNAWPYRDYVVRAFNEDRPYDQFIRDQIAGDAWGVDEATGFLVAGPWDQVKSPDEVLTKNQRADELHDVVGTTGSAFLGLTIGCSRCHHHKFDPIPQTDYFALKAVFAGVQHGERELNDADALARQQEAVAARARLRELEVELRRYEPAAWRGDGEPSTWRAPVHPQRNVERFAPIPARRLRFTIRATADAEPCVDELEVFAATAAGETNVALASAGTKATASGTYPNSDIHRLEHLNDGRYGNGRSWISNERGRGWVELEFPETVTIERIVWARDREAKFSDRLATDYVFEVSVEPDVWTTVASSRDRRPYQAGQPYQPDYSVANDPAQKQRVAEWVEEQARLMARVRELDRRPSVYAGKFETPEPTRRLHRGDPMQPREEVSPGGLTQITGVGKTLRLASEAPERERRQALADWLSDPANPLPARVMVNRLWQAHFGEGLVSTPSDFGLHGSRPTHPELLDWLASELIDSGWSLKHVHRLIVSSATYRQSSAQANPRAQSKDAGNRLLWRYPSRRLEAEAIRDSMLLAAGALDLRMGGPGWSPFAPNDNYVRVYAPKEEFTPADFRRMIYATVVRQRPDGVFGVFDCPDGGQVAPKRTRSTTPLQALNLLNSGLAMQIAEEFAARLEREKGTDGPAGQVERAFRLVFQRPPSAEESAAAAVVIAEHGLPAFCRALFNANEFVFVF